MTILLLASFGVGPLLISVDIATMHN